MNTRKFHLPGEAALLIVLLINPLAIDLMYKKRIWNFNNFLRAAHPQHSVSSFQFRNVELYLSNAACHHPDGPEAFVLSRLSVFFCCRHRIRKNDRCTQYLGYPAAKCSVAECGLLFHRISSDVLRHLIRLSHGSVCCRITVSFMIHPHHSNLAFVRTTGNTADTFAPHRRSFGTRRLFHQTRSVQPAVSSVFCFHRSSSRPFRSPVSLRGGH